MLGTLVPFPAPALCRTSPAGGRVAPSTGHNPSTVAGRIEQAGKIAAGLRARRRGWRVVPFRTGVVLVALVIVAWAYAFVISH